MPPLLFKHPSRKKGLGDEKLGSISRRRAEGTCSRVIGERGGRREKDWTNRLRIREQAKQGFGGGGL